MNRIYNGITALTSSTIINPAIFEYQNLMKITIGAAILMSFLLFSYFRNQNTRNLKISESNYKQLFNNLADQVFMADLKGKILMVNEIMCQQLSYSRGEMLGSTPRMFDRDYAENALMRMEGLRKNGSTMYETTYLTRSRRDVPVEVNSKRIDYNGESVSLNIIRNITGRKLFEYQIITLQNHSQQLTMADSLQKVASYTNSTLTEELGFDYSTYYRVNGEEMQLVGSTKPDNSTRLTCMNDCAMTRAIREKKSILVDNKRLQKHYTGRNHDTLCELNLPVIVDERVVGLICVENLKPNSIGKEEKNLVETIGLNITSTISRLESMEKMRESEERYRGIVENIESVIMLTDAGTINYASPSSVKVLGYTPEELQGAVPGYIHSHDQLRVEQVLSTQLSRESVAELEYRVKTKDNKTKWVSHNISKTQSGKHLSVITDITWRKEAEKELTEYTRFLENAKTTLKKSINELEETNQELDEFTRVVSHDLKAPLHSVVMFSTFIREQYKEQLDEEGAMYIERMCNAARRMSTLIDDLLTLSRVGRKNMETIEVDLNNMIDVVKMDLEAQIREKNAQLVYEPLPNIISQHVWLKQLFSNLISNGIKFNKSEPPVIEIHYIDQQDSHYFEITDNGIGIDPMNHDKLFKVFSRLHTEREYPGTGAGLSICKKIVKSLGGELGLRSELGKGSTFYFTIPKIPVGQREKQGVIEEELSELLPQL